MVFNFYNDFSALKSDKRIIIVNVVDEREKNGYLNNLCGLVTMQMDIQTISTGICDCVCA